MADAPDTVRIDRSELFPSPPSSPALSAPLPLDLELEFVTPENNAPTVIAEHDSGEEEEEGIDFPLFSTTTSTAATQRIRVRSPTPERTDEDVWDEAARTRKRPLDYWVLDAATLAARRKEFAKVVLSGEEVRAGAGVPWPGCRLPWRVVHIVLPNARAQKSAEKGKEETGAVCAEYMKDKGASEEREKCAKQKRPGKKRRAAIRVAKQKILAKEEARRKSMAGREKWAGLTQEEKDKLEKEERTRRNREKKAKRRVREKAKKAGSREEGDSAAKAASEEPAPANADVQMMG